MFQSSFSFVALIFLIMPKAHCSLNTMAFKIKVIAEAEAVENNLEIAQDYGLSESMVWYWRRDKVTILSGKLKLSEKCAKNGLFHSQVSWTRWASDGVVFTAERPKISFVLRWEMRRVCRVEWTLNLQLLYLSLNPKPLAISQTMFFVKNLQTFVSNTEKIAWLIGEEMW